MCFATKHLTSHQHGCFLAASKDELLTMIQHGAESIFKTSDRWVILMIIIMVKVYNCT